MKLVMYKQWLVNNIYDELYSLPVTSCSCCKHVDLKGYTCEAFPGISITEYINSLDYEHGCPSYIRNPKKYKSL